MTDVNEMLDNQAEKDKEERGAENWKPEPGEQLDGFIIKSGWYDGSEYEPSLWFLLKDIEGVTHRVYCSTVLRNQLVEEAPKMGSGIAVRYEGKKEGASGRTYKAWTFVLVPDKNGNVRRDFPYWEKNGVYRRNREGFQDRSQGNEDTSFF